MYICKDCGDTFDVAKSATEFQPYGNGYVAEPEHYVCPYCGGEFEEAQQCEICGEYCTSSDIHNGVCSYCLEEEFDDIDRLIQYSDSITKGGEINDFVKWCFKNNTEKMNSALKEALKLYFSLNKSIYAKFLTEYIAEDPDNMADWVKECQD